MVLEGWIQYSRIDYSFCQGDLGIFRGVEGGREGEGGSMYSEDKRGWDGWLSVSLVVYLFVCWKREGRVGWCLLGLCLG